MKPFIMNFFNVNKFNALVNDLSGNCFPISSDNKHSYTFQKVYSVGTFCYIVLYFVASIKAFFAVSILKSVQDGTVNIIVLFEVIGLTLYMNYHCDKYRLLIKKINLILDSGSGTLMNFISDHVKPVMKVFKLYTFVAVGSVIIWVLMPIIKVFDRNIFTIEDSRVPIDLFFSTNFGVNIYLFSVLLQVVGSGYTIFKKVAIDIYVVHLITLLTAKYSYLQYQLSTIFCNSTNNKFIEIELKQILEQHRIIVGIAQKLNKLLFVNIAVTYVNCTLRFCFLGFMVITIPGSYFTKIMVVSYSCGSLAEVYMLCSSVNRLLEVSSSISNQAFYEPWYNQKLYLQKVFVMITMTKMMKCRLSICESIDLTLPSFMSILKNAYSACLLLLKIK